MSTSSMSPEDIQTLWKVTPYILTVIGVYFYWSSMKKIRVFKDTPTSKIQSAAQGYVQFEGKGVKFEKDYLVSPHTGMPCLWYEYKLERYVGSGKNAHWKTEEHTFSEDLFLIRDKTGECFVNPTRAEVIESKRTVGYLDYNKKPSSFTRKYRVTERVLLPKDYITVIGEFRTIRRAEGMANTEELMGELLRKWKQDYDNLLKKYDANGDGQLDPKEWEQVMADARKAALADKAEAQADEGVNTIAFPYKHRKPFVISCKTEESIVKHYHLRMAGGAIAVFISLWMFVNPAPQWLLSMGDKKSQVKQSNDFEEYYNSLKN